MGNMPTNVIFPHEKKGGATFFSFFFFAATITYGINNIFIFYLINFDITCVTIFFFLIICLDDKYNISFTNFTKITSDHNLFP